MIDLTANQRQPCKPLCLGDLRAKIASLPDETPLELVFVEEHGSYYDNKEVPITHIQVNSRGVVMWNDDNVC